MRELTSDDLGHVLAHIPRDVRKLMRDEGAIIGGGYIRAMIAREKPSDIDLFGPDKETLEDWAKDLALARKGRLHKTPNAYTVLSPPRLPVQFIHRWTYRLPENGPRRAVDNRAVLCAVVDDFDFTIAQAAIGYVPEEDEETPGEWISVISDRFYPDLAGKRLVYQSPDRVEDVGGSLLRVRKFLARGYRIDAMNLAKVVARLTWRVDFDRIENEEHLGQILCGLLREVDPLLVIDGLDIALEHEPISHEQIAHYLKPDDREADDGSETI